MTVGFYSPLPPARTGVADYSAALLSDLRKRGNVEVAPPRCDIGLYHLGNNPLHAEAYCRALEWPGVVVLHDAVLNHFLLGSLDERPYCEEFVYNYGEWYGALAEDLWKSRASSAADSRYFEFPMLRRAIESARAVIVHNEEAGRVALRHAPEARVVVIPHLFYAPAGMPPESEASRFCQRLGVDPGAFLFGVFGYLRESKRLEQTLSAFGYLRREGFNAALLVAGRFVSEDYGRLLGPLLQQPGVVRLPYLAEREFWLAAASVDGCVNLRYPSAGETSGIAVRLMGLGKPVLLTGAPESSAFPEDACIRIAAGASECESLFEHMRLLVSMRDLATELGRRAAEHIRLYHSLERAGDAYWKLLCECLG